MRTCSLAANASATSASLASMVLVGAHSRTKKARKAPTHPATSTAAWERVLKNGGRNTKELTFWLARSSCIFWMIETSENLSVRKTVPTVSAPSEKISVMRVLHK